MAKCMYCGLPAKKNHVCIECEKAGEKIAEDLKSKKQSLQGE